MKLVATTIAALGLMAAPLAAQEAAQAPQSRTAGVAQQAQLSQAPALGIPPTVLGVGAVVVIIGGAIALSDSSNSTSGTR